MKSKSAEEYKEHFGETPEEGFQKLLQTSVEHIDRNFNEKEKKEFIEYFRDRMAGINLEFNYENMRIFSMGVAYSHSQMLQNSTLVVLQEMYEQYTWIPLYVTAMIKPKLLG